MISACYRFSALGCVGAGEWAGSCPFARHRPTQPHETRPLSTSVRQPNDFRPPTESINAKHCVDARNHVPSNQPRCTGDHQPERLTMSIILAPTSADTAGLTIEDTGVIKAFAIMAGVGTAFLASAVLAIVSIA